MISPAAGRHALVLSGGGATGAYEVGVVSALLGGKSPATGGSPIVPGICAGTSVGSYNAAFLVSQLDAYGPLAAANLQATWLDLLSGRGRSSFGNGIYRFRFDPFSFLEPAYYLPNPLRPLLDGAGDAATLFWDGLNRLVHLATDRDSDLRQRVSELFNFASFISLEPFIATIAETIDFVAIRRAKTELRIPATNWNTGRLTVFRNSEMTDKLGPLAIRASTAIPGLFPPVAIGAEPHVDGGVLMNTPLRLVTRHADVLHVIYLDPEVAVIPNSTLDSTLASAYRQQVISWAKVMTDDIADARAINQVLALKERADRGEPLDGGSPEDHVGGLSGLLRRLEERDPPYRLLTIHRYHPRDDLTGGPLGLLRLERESVRELIERGFSDAVEHDCQASECILPGMLDRGAR
jgi:predicted acylesterase/phospholipase RssA